jgi:hypothetical protein
MGNLSVKGRLTKKVRVYTHYVDVDTFTNVGNTFLKSRLRAVLRNTSLRFQALNKRHTSEKGNDKHLISKYILFWTFLFTDPIEMAADRSDLTNKKGREGWSRTETLLFDGGDSVKADSAMSCQHFLIHFYKRKSFSCAHLIIWQSLNCWLKCFEE